MSAPKRPTRVDEAISPKTADALLVVMTHEGVDLAEALRRLVGYGELVFRTIRLEGGDMLLRHGNDIERVAILDPLGEPLVRDVAPLVWMRPTWSTVACGFPGVEIAAGLDPLEDDKAERCPACRRTAKRWRAR